MSTAIAPHDPYHPKLPLRDTITLAYSSYLQSFRDVLRISWLWLAAIVLLTLVSSWMEASWMAGVPNKLSPGTHLEARPIAITILSLVVALVYLLAGLSIAVAWHRRLILGEPPGISGGNIISNSLWRYVGAAVLISVIVTLPIVVVLLLLWSLTNGHDMTLLIAAFVPLPLCATMYAVLLRLSPVLPARAVTDLTLTISQAWAYTRGSTWRLFWGTIACAFLPLCAMPILLALVGFYNPNTFTAGSVAVINTLNTVYNLLVLPIGIGFLSYTYRHFFGPVSHPARPAA